MAVSSSKRLLYHPAPAQTPPLQTKKSLVQGTLFSSSDSLTQGTRTLSADGNPFYKRHPVEQRPSPYAEPPRLGTSKMTNSSPQKSPLLIKSILEDPNYAGPRRFTPEKYTQSDTSSFQQLSKPSSSLSLSDEDFNQSTKNQDNKGITTQEIPATSEAMRSPVLMVDASRHHRSPSLAEVPVVTSVIKSPVQVICHSPRSKQNKMSIANNSAHTTTHTNVAGPTKTMTGESENTTTAETITGHTNTASRVDIPGIKPFHLQVTMKDKTSQNNQSNELGEELGHEEEYKSFMDDRTTHVDNRNDMTLGSTSIHQPLFDISGISQDASVSSVSTLGDTSESKKRGKKAKGRFVPSRYMQTVVPKAATKVDKKKSTSQITIKAKGLTQSAKKPKATSFQSRNTDAITPFFGHVTKKGEMVTSTPAVTSAASVPTCQALPTPILSQPNVVQKSILTKTQGKTTQAAQSSKMPTKYVKPGLLAASEGLGLYRPRKSVKTKSKEQGFGQKGSSSMIVRGGCSGDISQHQLDLEYARLVQWLFLDSKLKHTFALQEKQAQSQIYAAWQENEKMMREVADLQIKLEQLKKEKELDERIKTQLSALEPLDDRFKDLFRGYTELAGALDTTRHHMPVHGAILPSDLEQLIAALNESEQLLGELQSLTTLQQPKVTALAQEMKELSTVVSSEVEEQSSCKELLAAASTLSTQEFSLLAQTIQENNDERSN